jgi:hypothetical protein
VADWRELYAAAAVNSDPRYLETVVDEARRAMEIRLNELACIRGYSNERSEIALAMRSLIAMRVKRTLSETDRDRS